MNAKDWAYRVSASWQPKRKDMTLDLSFQHFRSDSAGGIDLVNCDKLRGRPLYSNVFATGPDGEQILDGNGNPTQGVCLPNVPPSTDADSDTDADACRTTCLLPACGDGVVDSGEACDDGDAWGGDGCTPACQVEDGQLDSEPNDAWDEARDAETEAIRARQKARDDREELDRVSLQALVFKEALAAAVPDIRVLDGEARRIADEILTRRPRVRLVTIAGPSSSGKTTFAKRLGVQLRVNGLQPVSLSLDNYYVDRTNTPVDEDGELRGGDVLPGFAVQLASLFARVERGAKTPPIS